MAFSGNCKNFMHFQSKTAHFELKTQGEIS